MSPDVAETEGGQTISVLSRSDHVAPAVFESFGKAEFCVYAMCVCTGGRWEGIVKSWILTDVGIE